MRVLYAYLCLLLLGFVSGKCVDINTSEIESRLNLSYDSDCYIHNTEAQEELKTLRRSERNSIK